MTALQEKEALTLTHPKIHRALTTFVRLVGLDASFEENIELENKIKRMHIHFNEGDGCYTDMNAIFLGLQFPYFQGELNEVYPVAKTISGHEMAHIRFTCKDAWNRFVHRAMREYGAVAGFAKSVLNILEDRRIERLMGMVSEFLQENFFLLGWRISKEIEEEMTTLPVSMDAQQKLEVLARGLLYCSFMRMIPVCHNKEIRDYLTRCFPYVLYARESDHTKGAVEATEKIMEILRPLVDAFKKTGGKFPEMEKNKDVGTYHPTEKGGFTPLHEKEEAVEVSAAMKEMLEQLRKKAEEDIKKAKAEKGKKGKEKEKGNGEAPESDKDIQHGEEENDPHDRNYVDDITGNLEIEQEKEAYRKQAEKTAKAIQQKKEQESITDTLLRDALRSTKKDQQQLIKEKKEIEKVQSIVPKSMPDIHQHARAVFVEKDKMSTFTTNEYEGIKREWRSMIKKTATEIQDLSQRTIERTLRQKKRGKLDRRKIAKLAALGDPRSFIKRKIEEEQLSMEVLLLVDISGSNSSQVLNKKNDTYLARYRWNQAVAILLHEILKEVKFEHSVWTFHERGRNSEFSTPIDRSNCFERDAGLYLKEISAKAGNRDGFAIRYAGEYLNGYSTSDKRLLIVLSDGQPAGHGYGGVQAMQDVKQAVVDVEKGGASVIGIFTGDESENKYFREMYPQHLFVNNDSIADLPKKLKDMLLEEFREYIERL